MNRFISPPVDQIDKLRTPLTDGEKIVLDFFDRNLTHDWEIYIQPHLNGLRPDFVLLNKNVGIGVFEVKDWNLNAMEYFVEEYKLYGLKDGIKFSLEKNNPISKIKIYKEEIFNLYCPRMTYSGMEIKSYAAINNGVIFPFAYSEQLKKLFSPIMNSDDKNYITISGISELVSNNIGYVFPNSMRKSSFFMNQDYADDLRGWLIEPNFSATQRKKISFDERQQDIVTSRTESGYRRIKGPAGSGKTMLLAARAAYLANQEKKVLICTYNITLYNYIHDIIVRFIDKKEKIDNIVLINFHAFCKRIAYIYGYEKEYKKLFLSSNSEQKILEELIPELIKNVAYSTEIEKFDSIFVDEGQDFKPLWWNVLRAFCKDEGEKLLAVDQTQDVYERSKNWTDEVMSGLGFRGKWVQLEISYRMDPKMIQIAQDFGG